MKERKYKESYRFVTRIDEKSGRERRSAEYIGEYFRFPALSPAPRRRAARLAAPLALYWAAALAYMKTAGITGRCIYALPPFMLGLFPGVYGLMGLYAMLRAPERMTIVQRENGVGRLMRNGLGCGVFASLGAVGGAICLCAANGWASGWHEPLLALAAAAGGWALFTLARRDYRALESAGR